MFSLRKTLTATAVAAAVLVAPAAANAATITVDTGDDGVGGCTLRNAIESADGNANQPGCTATNLPYGNDTVVVPAGVASPILLGTEIAAGGMGTLTVQGPGVGNLDVRGGAGFRVFHIVGTGAVTISGLTISNGNQTGTAAQGGGVRVAVGGNLTLNNVTVTGNTVTASGMNTFVAADGGAIYSDGGLFIFDSTISNNSATAALTAGVAGQSSAAAGAGVFVSGASDLAIHRSTISGNTATATAPGGTDGSFATAGGIQIGNGGTNNATIGRTTISGNQLSASNPAFGGGIYANAGIATILSSSTITKNTASGAANVSGSGVNLGNTIVSNPQGGGPNCGNLAGSSTAGFNLEDANTCGFSGPSDQPSVAVTGLDPNLANNGGPTMTHALLPGSPAIDEGHGLAHTTDQRGAPFARPVDFPGVANDPDGDGGDIGAFELQQACAGQATPATSCTPPTGNPPTVVPLVPTTTNPPAPPPARKKKCKKKKKRGAAAAKKCKKRKK